MFVPRLLVGLVLTAPTLAPSGAGDSHSFVAPLAEGTRLDKTFRVRAHMDSGEFRVFMGGQPVPSQYLPELAFSEEHSIRVEVRDTFGASEDGRLMGFEREYQELAGEGSYIVEVPPEEPEQSDWQRESGLVGERVAFTWDAKAEGYGGELVGGGECPEPLDRLQGRMDLQEFLPESEVKTGDTWTVDGQALLELLNPAGRLDLNRSEDEPGEAPEPVGCDGEFTVTFKQVWSEEGATLARLEIEGECERTAEQAGDLSRVPVADGTATDTITWNYQLEGELLWNLDGGHAVRLDLSGSFDQLLRTDRDPGQGGMDYASEIESKGDLEIHVEFSVAEGGRE